MSTFTADPQFKLYAICCSILSVQMLLLGGLTAAKRAKNMKHLNPEDTSVAFKGTTLVGDTEPPDVARIQRAHRNLLESLPLFFALGLIYVLAGGSPLGAQICFGAFTGARVLHSIVYINALQPWRTITYAIGTFALVGLVVQILLTVLA